VLAGQGYAANLIRVDLAVAFAAMWVTAVPVNAAVLYSTGFEPPTYTTGVLAGQDSWAEFPVASAAVQVENAVAFSGTQAVEVIPALAASQDGPYRAVPTGAPIVIQSAEIYLASSSTESGWQYAATGAGLIGYAGGIDIDAGTNAIRAITAGFPVIGSFTRNAWNKVDLILNYTTQTYEIDLNGVAIDSNVPFCGSNIGCSGAPIASYVDGFFDTFAAVNANDIGYIDNYSVSTLSAVPEPSALLLLGAALAGLGVVRRKRGGRPSVSSQQPSGIPTVARRSRAGA
jgi:hypothetical protein